LSFSLLFRSFWLAWKLLQDWERRKEMNMLNPNIEARNSKQDQITEDPNPKRYDLEERTLKYAQRVNSYAKKLPKTIPNLENGRQLVRASGSVGANYIEANEALSRKDFIMRIKISRKEAKESRFWLYLTDPLNSDEPEKNQLIDESTQLMKIFSSILIKCK
jgi:four helix bundle protein